MSIQPTLLAELATLGETITLRALAAQPERTNAIALRHDIDHDLDLALELAHHEHRLGLRATYFLLHTHRYWQDPQLIDKCRQLEAYGHEVGLHINVLSEWFEGACDDIDARLREVLEPLRAAGVTITGVSAHGDRLCYQHGFINYWMWRELRGDDPAAQEQGKSAEGVRVEDARWQVPYPADHALRRRDGATLPLWRSSLADHGLVYDGVHLPVDRYWTDTGGEWTRSGNPFEAELRTGRHQLLIHPVWWRGEAKQCYCLSTARSGSKWLANFVDRATSWRGVHEWTLNHRREGPAMIADKRTDDDYVGLCGNRATAVHLIREAASFAAAQPRDWFEANVYLDPFLPELREIAPRATIVHLHRDARDVVRSLLNRDWYDTPGDRRHRRVDGARWDSLNQFERACWYVRAVNETIAPHATARLSFERMVSDREYLARQLAALGMVVHPLLAEQEHAKVINESRGHAFPPHTAWTREQQVTFERICGHVQRVLGYGSEGRLENNERFAPGTASVRDDQQAEEQVLMDWSWPGNAAPAHHAVHAEVSFTESGLTIRADGQTPNAHVLLARGKWGSVSNANGFNCDEHAYVHGLIRATLPPASRARLFVLFFDASGTPLRRHAVATLRSEQTEREFAFSGAIGASHFAMALHLGHAGPDEAVTLQALRLERRSMSPAYAARPSVATDGAASPAAAAESSITAHR